MQRGKAIRGKAIRGKAMKGNLQKRLLAYQYAFYAMGLLVILIMVKSVWDGEAGKRAKSKIQAEAQLERDLNRRR